VLYDYHRIHSKIYNLVKVTIGCEISHKNSKYAEILQ
jgi:hypothetical protein